jgi:hypothetical protein
LIFAPGGKKIEGILGINKLVEFLITWIMDSLVLTEISINHMSPLDGMTLVLFCGCVIFIGKYTEYKDNFFIKEYLIEFLEAKGKNIKQEGSAEGLDHDTPKTFYFSMSRRFMNEI